MLNSNSIPFLIAVAGSFLVALVITFLIPMYQNAESKKGKTKDAQDSQ